MSVYVTGGSAVVCCIESVHSNLWRRLLGSVPVPVMGAGAGQRESVYEGETERRSSFAAC